MKTTRRKKGKCRMTLQCFRSNSLIRKFSQRSFALVDETKTVYVAVLTMFKAYVLMLAWTTSMISLSVSKTVKNDKCLLFLSLKMFEKSMIKHFFN